MTGSGIYVHLPYCGSRCGYCAFVVSTDRSTAGAYWNALDREMELVGPEASGAYFDSLYLGGGTPSLTPEAELRHLLDGLRRSFAVSPGAEVTLEANPEDVTAVSAQAWASAGVNRVSVGVQSFEDRELSAVGRRHDSAGASGALETLAGRGFSLSGDPILGLPEQTAASFRRSVARLGGSGVEHVSVYLLEAEKSRTMEEDRRLHPERYLSDDEQADAWLEMGESLSAAGFRHYEISNWAREGRQARHNVKYWRRTPTLGLGVSAHELWAGRRRANVSGLERYIGELESGRRPVARDQALGADEERREAIVLGLRLSEGVASGRFGEAVREFGDAALGADSEAWLEAGLLEEAGGRIRFTERGFLLSNEILCRFV
ncbi:MAG TPA: radical SAM family heme chaperone HemW [Thermoanaerobaculia bacterium]|nr:radical SAM family heme chaperone HemW [Thermoanaerobaculia bacterium]